MEGGSASEGSEVEDDGADDTDHIGHSTPEPGARKTRNGSEPVLTRKWGGVLDGIRWGESEGDQDRVEDKGEKDDHNGETDLTQFTLQSEPRKKNRALHPDGPA